MRKRLFILTILFVLKLSAIAKVSVEARLDSVEIFIGQQVQITLSVTTDKSANVFFPVFTPRQQIIPGVEVLNTSETKIDAIENGVLYSRVYTLTSFDAGLYYLPPFEVNVDKKVYKSESLALKVLSVNVDTTDVFKYYGPKDIQTNPFKWSDWSWLFGLSILMLILLSLDYYFYLRLRDNKPIIKKIKFVKRLLPHQKAIKAIEQIKAEKHPASDNPKEYYTKLTDALRKYIQERFGFNAMEMTSNEIIERLKNIQEPKDIYELGSLFQVADLVKFAKYSTLINEDDKNLVNAIAFINSTKIEKVIDEKDHYPQLTNKEVRSIKTRNFLRITITGIAISCLTLLCYIVYGISQILIL